MSTQNFQSATQPSFSGKRRPWTASLENMELTGARTQLPLAKNALRASSGAKYRGCSNDTFSLTSLSETCTKYPDATTERRGYCSKIPRSFSKHCSPNVSPANTNLRYAWEVSLNRFRHWFQFPMRPRFSLF